MKKIPSLFWFSAAEALAATIILLASPSKEEGYIAGYSLIRLGMIAVAFALACVSSAIALWLTRKQGIANNFESWLAQQHEIILRFALFVLIFTFGLIFIALRGDWILLGNIGSYIQRGLPLLIWFALFILQFQTWMTLNGFSRASQWDKKELFSFCLVAALITFMALDSFLRDNGVNPASFKKFAQLKIIPNLWWLFIILAIAVMLNMTVGAKEKGAKPYLFFKTLCTSRPLCLNISRALFIFIAAWFIYQYTGFIGRWYFRAPEQSYFPYLADAFLHGKLYLSNPISLVELTPYNGNWYVPYPPLAAILMMPLVALRGVENVNSSGFSIFFAAMTVGLVFLILEKISERGWTKLNPASNLWLTSLFALSTPFWQIVISGEVWYINQTMTLFFVAAAVLSVLVEASPLLVGLMLGLAILARPPIGLMGIFLFGIFYQIQQDKAGKVPFGKWFKWGVLTAIPVSLIVGAFLIYNHARFENPFDFGYTNMNIGEPARTDVRTYGQFNIRYLSRNLDLMFFGFPHWDTECNFYTVKIDGASMFLATPALIYLLGSFRKKIWVAGAWVASIALIVPLTLYFTTGIFQFGYRYLLDLFIPLLALIAVAMPREKLPLHTKVFILAGILVNYWGVWWFYRHWCR